MKFTYRFPYKLEEQTKIDDESDYYVYSKEYTCEVPNDVYEALALNVYIEDWFPRTYRMLGEREKQVFLKEAYEKFMKEDLLYEPYYEGKVRAMFLFSAFQKFCYEQTVMTNPAELLGKTPIPILQELNDIEYDVAQPMHFSIVGEDPEV